VRFVRDLVPEFAILPDQLPEAVQAFTFVADHVRLLAPPDCTVLGLAEILRVGGGGVTVTITD
jgi:hypothetical protein